MTGQRQSQSHIIMANAGMAGELLDASLHLSQVYAAKPNSRPDRPLASATSGDIASTTRAPQIWIIWMSCGFRRLEFLKEAPYKSHERGNSVVFLHRGGTIRCGPCLHRRRRLPARPSAHAAYIQLCTCSWVKVLC